MKYLLTEICKQYGDHVVLRQVTCAIPVVGLTVVMGPSGSGKSTLLRLLSFVESPDAGTVRLELDDTTFSSRGPERPWPRVTCVFQKLFLWPHLTILDNLRLPLAAAGRERIERRLSEVIDLFGMGDFVRRYPNEVSGGQTQRAALARAFLLDPQLILIDEAHTGLDLEQQTILNRYLLTLRSSGVGLIIVTHSIDFARHYADRIVIVEKSYVVEDDRDEIFARSPSSEYVRRAMEIFAPNARNGSPQPGELHREEKR